MTPFKRKLYYSIVRLQEIEKMPLNEAIQTTLELLKDEPQVKYVTTHQIGIELNKPRIKKYREKIKNGILKFT